jgi:hypothetical protein
MVEEAALLVIGDEQHGLAEHIRVRREDVDDLRDVPGANVRKPVRMFCVCLRRDDPGHLRQSSVLDVVTEDVHQVLRIAIERQDVRAGSGAIRQRRSGQRVLILMKVEQ